MIERQERGPVAVLRMRHGKANAIDTDLLSELRTELEGLRAEERAVILTGNDHMFSAGVDLRRLLELGSEYTGQLITSFQETLDALVEFPRPVVAAVNGHAIAGGLVLACACDLRLLAEGPAKLGLTELAVGVPFPATALEVVRLAVGPERTRQLVYERRLLSAAEAASEGLVDELVPPDELLARSHTVASELAAVPAVAFELTKRQLTAPLRERLERVGAVHERRVRRQWTSEETVARIRRFVEDHLR